MRLIVCPDTDEMVLDYKAYLGTLHWRLLKSHKADRHGKHCQQCGTSVGVDLHHVTYERLGHERDEDTVFLCRKHHEAAHVDRIDYAGTPTRSAFVCGMESLVARVAGGR